MSPSIAEPTLDFRSDGSVLQSGPLLGGHTVRIRYDRSRLAGGRELAGVETATWMVSGFCSMNGGEPRPFALGEHASGVISEQRLRSPRMHSAPAPFRLYSSKLHLLSLAKKAAHFLTGRAPSAACGSLGGAG